MSANSKKRRLARRAAGQPIVDNGIPKLYDELTQITNQQIKQPKKKSYLSMSVWLQTERNRKNHKKVFRDERRKLKLELQRAAEKALRLKNSQLAELRAERRAKRKAVHG